MIVSDDSFRLRDLDIGGTIMRSSFTDDERVWFCLAQSQLWIEVSQPDGPL